MKNFVLSRHVLNMAQNLGFVGRMERYNDYLWLCEVQRWLRVTYNVQITVAPYIDEFEYFVYLNRDPEEKLLKSFKDYESALEYGIKQALKLIK